MTPPVQRCIMSSMPPDFLTSYLTRHGCHSLSYSTLQPGLTHFVEETLGYLAYRRIGRFSFVLADPVCADSDIPTLIDRFHEAFDRPAYVHVGRRTAEVLANRGYRCNRMGQESTVDLRRFRPTWRSHRSIRESVRRFRRADLTVMESSLKEMAALGIGLDNIRSVSDLWLRRQGGRELRFLTRQMNLNGATEIRRFFMLRGDDLVGFTFFDPVYSNGQVVGYCPNIARFDDRSLPTGRSAYINLVAGRQFEREGIHRLYLGLLPLDGDLRADLPESRLLRLMFQTARRHSIGFNFEGLARHKAQYRGDVSGVYYASSRRGLDFLLELRSLAALLNLF